MAKDVVRYEAVDGSIWPTRERAEARDLLCAVRDTLLGLAGFSPLGKGGSTDWGNRAEYFAEKIISENPERAKDFASHWSN